MNILVTGGAGFIGSHVSEALIRHGGRVTILDDFNDFYDPALKQRNVTAVANRATVVEGDIRDQRLVKDLFAEQGYDAVVHLAARAGVRPSLKDPSLYTETNIVGTQNLLEASRASGVKKWVFASSSSIYGANEHVPFKESDPVTRPISPYAATKLAGEALCHVYHHLYDIDMVCLRFFTVYGPRQRPDLAIHKFTRAITSAQPIDLYGDGSSQRDYTHIDDIVRGVIAAVDRSFGYEVINLGESRTVALIELVRLLEQQLGQRAEIRWLDAQPGDVPITYADISKARQLLDYDPQTSIEDGLAQFVAWYRADNQANPVST